MTTVEDRQLRSEDAMPKARRTRLSLIRRALRSAPISAWFGMIVIATYVIVAIFAPWLAPYGEAQIFPEPYAPWGGQFVLGTDQLGRDMLTRLIYGARNTIGIALVTTLLSFAVGMSLFLMTLCLNVISQAVLRRFREGYS